MRGLICLAWCRLWVARLMLVTLKMYRVVVVLLVVDRPGGTSGAALA